MVHNYLRLVKFSHTLFSLPFALASFFLAVKMEHSEFSWKELLLVVVALVFARNAAMAFNRYTDRHYDKANPRTFGREIPAGLLTPGSVLVFVILNSLLFMATAWLINPLCFFLSPVALLVILGYSLTKRFTALCHFFLGLGLALAPLGAWLAATGIFHYVPVLISVAVLFWVAGFDILYALQDEEFDKANSLKSIPAALGRKGAMRLSSWLHLVCFSALFVVSWCSGFGVTGWTGTALFGCLLLYQHLIIKPGNISRINLAFFTTNGIASVLYAIAVILDVFF